MRIYRIDELEPTDVEKIKEALADKGYSGSIDDIYNLPIPDSLLSEEQLAHQENCGPHNFTLETGDDWLALELLLRARGRIRCSCISYATPEQRAYVIDFLDDFIKELDISV